MNTGSLRFPLIRREEEKVTKQNSKCAGRSRLVSRGRSRFHSAGTAGKLRRIRSGRTAFRAKTQRKENLRGTFHCHTVASDGHNTPRRNGRAARELGLEYLGIADHSRSSVQGHGMLPKSCSSKSSRIRNLNKTFDGFVYLRELNATSLRDGSLDFPDEVLSQSNYVVASVHFRFHLSESEMTQARNPRVGTIRSSQCGAIRLADCFLNATRTQIDIPAVLERGIAHRHMDRINAAPSGSTSIGGGGH